MAIDLTGFRADTVTLLDDWGETVSIHRLTVNYDTVPPSETWDEAATGTMEIQPISGTKFRHDAGTIATSTHWGLASHDAGYLVGDRVFRTGDSNYYEVLRADNLEDHFEIWMKYVAGAV